MGKKKKQKWVNPMNSEPKKKFGPILPEDEPIHISLYEKAELIIRALRGKWKVKKGSVKIERSIKDI